MIFLKILNPRILNIKNNDEMIWYTKEVVENPFTEGPVDFHEVCQPIKIFPARDPVRFFCAGRLLTGIIKAEQAALQETLVPQWHIHRRSNITLGVKTTYCSMRLPELCGPPCSQCIPQCWGPFLEESQGGYCWHSPWQTQWASSSSVLLQAVQRWKVVKDNNK